MEEPQHLWTCTAFAWRRRPAACGVGNQIDIEIENYYFAAATGDEAFAACASTARQQWPLEADWDINIKMGQVPDAAVRMVATSLLVAGVTGAPEGEAPQLETAVEAREEEQER